MTCAQVRAGALALKGRGCGGSELCNALFAEAGQSVSSSSVLTVNKDYVGYFAGACLMPNPTLQWCACVRACTVLQ